MAWVCSDSWESKAQIISLRRRIWQPRLLPIRCIPNRGSIQSIRTVLATQFGEEVPADFEYVINVNLAFCLELYLKCLLVLDGRTPKKDHKLRGHFDKLAQDTQGGIRTEYQQILKTDAYMVASTKSLDRSAKTRIRSMIRPCS